MEGLLNLGLEIVISPLRPPVKPQGVSGLMVPEARVVLANLTPRDLVDAQIWLIRSRPACFRRCWREVVRYFRMYLTWRLNLPYGFILPSDAI